MGLNKKKVAAVFDMYINGRNQNKETAVKIRNLNKRELVEILLNRINHECWIPYIGDKNMNYDFERFVSRSIDGYE